MKTQLKFFFTLLFFLLFAYLLRPSHQHLDKLFVVKGISLAAVYKQAVSNYLDKYKKLPDDNDFITDPLFQNIRVNLDNTAVERISVGENGPGTITVHYNSKQVENAPQAIDDQEIILSPNVFGDRITWQCRGTMDKEYLPVACQ